MEKISRFFVEERDPLYKKGKLEGKLEAEQETELRKNTMFVRNLLQDGTYSLEKICLIAGVELTFVLEVKAQWERAQNERK